MLMLPLSCADMDVKGHSMVCNEDEIDHLLNLVNKMQNNKLYDEV